MTPALPRTTRWVIVGAGFAGASTAWALGRAGLGPGLVLEQEFTYGVHASGRNAALLRVAEADPILLALARRSLDHLAAFDAGSGTLLRRTGGLTLADRETAAALEEAHRALGERGLATELWTARAARAHVALLEAVHFDVALWCALEAVVDIHALLSRYLQLAREQGFSLVTGCRVEDLLVDAGRIVGVRTTLGAVRAETVVDASGAWAGRLGRGGSPLPLQPLRRHLFVTGAPAVDLTALPFVWHEDAAFYFRREGDGLLFSPCDETPSAPGPVATDPAAAELLAGKLARYAPRLAELPVKRSWACLRTFAPDRKPLIGPDPDRPGLFHVSGLGGFGVTASAAVGELAAACLAGRTPDWIDTRAVAPDRFARRSSP
jgi:glycine/D-amino acid oxidase-like deaminating enzyme